MSDVKRFAVPGRYLVAGGKNPGAQDVVLATDYAALEAECDALRAQLPSQGGEAVEVVGWRRLDRPYELTAYPSVCAMWHGVGYPVQALYTHPVGQVADDLTRVKVPRELLERLYRVHKPTMLDRDIYELRALLNGGRDE